MSNNFIDSFKEMQRDVHRTADSKGWWDDRKKIEQSAGSIGLQESAETQVSIACLALVMTECAEAIEALRHGNPPDDKIPLHNGAVAEMADAVIRLMDLAECRGWRLAEAISDKAKMNKGRAYMHGGKVA